VKESLLASENILEASVDLCLQIAEDLISFCTANNIPFGFNIESVAIRKEEIEASIRMVNQMSEMLKSQGIRK
jgi:hypothetical protein